MPRLLFARAASSAPMGAQRHEREVIAGAQRELVGDGWQTREFVVRSLRSPLPGDRRLPLTRLAGAPRHLRRLTGHIAYPRHDILHRLGLDLPPGPTTEIVTVQDVAPWRFSDEAPPMPWAATELRRAAAVITVSEFSADECEDVLGIRRPFVIPNGVDDRFLQAVPADRETLRGLGIPGPYVLCAGGATIRKNLPSLALGWPLVRQVYPEISLVLTGPPAERRTRLFADVAGTVMPGRVADDVVPHLVAGAACVVVPSVYEGFGLPALEAMAARTPVVAAATASLPEVVGDGGLLVEPTAEALAHGITRALAGGPEIEAAVARGWERGQTFTWARVARAHAQIWRDVAGLPGGHA